MQTNLISQAILTAAVAALKMATSEEDSNHLTPAELQTLIDNEMTEDALTTFSSLNKVYIEITELDEAIDALIDLKGEEEPETKAYDMALLKLKIDYGRTQQEKHEFL